MATRARGRGFGPYGDLGGWARGLGVSVAAAVFLSVSGAFGTGDAPAGPRLAYWVLLMVLGTLWGSTVAGVLLRPAERKGLWLRVALTALAMAAPFTLVVWLAGRLIGSSAGLDDLPGIFLAVAVISLAMTALNVLVESRRLGHAPAATSPAPPKFLERLPLKLRGAEVWAVEAEDHYLRLHTSKGQDLILMRLADAVAELEGIEGAQVHRSWWVARDAIVGARRGDGRATLRLKDGAEVPVSRTYAGALRDRGWI